jgi:beta-glucosidase
VCIDDEMVVDNKRSQRDGTSFFAIGILEERGLIYPEAGKQHRLFVQYSTAPTSNVKHHGVV